MAVNPLVHQEGSKTPSTAPTKRWLARTGNTRLRFLEYYESLAGLLRQDGRPVLPAAHRAAKDPYARKAEPRCVTNIRIVVLTRQRKRSSTRQRL